MCDPLWVSRRQARRYDETGHGERSDGRPPIALGLEGLRSPFRVLAHGLPRAVLDGERPSDAESIGEGSYVEHVLGVPLAHEIQGLASTGRTDVVDIVFFVIE